MGTLMNCHPRASQVQFLSVPLKYLRISNRWTPWLYWLIMVMNNPSPILRCLVEQKSWRIKLFPWVCFFWNGDEEFDIVESEHYVKLEVYHLCNSREYNKHMKSSISGRETEQAEHHCRCAEPRLEIVTAKNLRRVLGWEVRNFFCWTRC